MQREPIRDNHRCSHHAIRTESTGSDDGTGDMARFSSGPVDMDAVFRSLIELECRCGALSRSRRRRIIQYGAQLGLSPVELGALIDQAVRAQSKNTHRPGALRLRAAKRAVSTPADSGWACVLLGTVLLLLGLWLS